MSTFEDYKKLRNKVRKFDPLSIVLPSIQKLHESSKKPPNEYGGYTPWNLLYLIKIAFLEGGKNGAKIATIRDINTTLNQIINLGDGNRFLNGEMSGLRKFMRMLAFQQFWFQRSITSDDLARQLLIFNKESAAKWHEQFYLITGLPLRTFLQMLMAVLAGFIDNSGRFYITKSWFDPLGLDEDMIESFFHLVSLNVEKTKEFFELHYKNTENKLLQLTEQTPLKEYPFLQIGDKYFCYSPHVLQEKIKHTVYDTLKSKHGNDFTQSFGRLFENYVYRMIEELDIPSIPEAEFKHLFPGKRVCDAVIDLDNALILLEIKGVEMHPYAQINPTNAILTRQLETNIIKSFEQIYEVANLLSFTEKGREILRGREIFAVVVTYKEMYLSDGQDVWDEFLSEPLQKYATEKRLDISCIPLKNILFLSVKSFEELVKVILANGNIIYKIIKRAVENNSDPKTKKYLFELHLDGYEQKSIQILGKIFDEVTGELEERLC